MVKYVLEPGDTIEVAGGGMGGYIAVIIGVVVFFLAMPFIMLLCYFAYFIVYLAQYYIAYNVF